MRFNQYNYLVMTVFIILISVGVVNASSTPPFIMAVSEDSPSTDVILGIDITSTLEARGYEMPEGYNAILVDLKWDDIENNVVLHINEGKATIMVSDHVSDENKFINALENVLEDLGIKYEIIKPTLTELGGGIVHDTTEEMPQIPDDTNETVILNESNDTDNITIKECELDADCADNFACTVDTCAEYTCIHVSQEGCEFNGECVAEKSIQDNQYCDDNSMEKLKENKQSCTSSYECSSENCGNGLCKNKGFFQTIGEWLGRLF